MADYLYLAIKRRLQGCIICDICGADINTYANKCQAPLEERCPGYDFIEHEIKILDFDDPVKE